MSTRRTVLVERSDASGFSPITLSPTTQVLSQSREALRWGKIKTFDVVSKIATRILLVFSFLLLLAYQNRMVFSWIDRAKTEDLEQWSAILSVLFPATLLETYLVVKEIVRWAMKEIPYNDLEG